MEHGIRAKFETWYSDNGKSPKAIERSPDGEYKLMNASLSFIAFQAGAESAEKQRDELLAALELIYSWASHWDSEFMFDPDWKDRDSVTIQDAIANAKGV